MAVELNHTIVKVRDKVASATFYRDVLGLEEFTTYGPFTVISLANGATLDFLEDVPIHSQHYAFLVSEEEFDQIRVRIRERGLVFWADPYHHRPGEINTNDGGRGLYWQDPDGHNLEIITRPYGG